MKRQRPNNDYTNNLRLRAGNEASGNVPPTARQQGRGQLDLGWPEQRTIFFES
jgi:hypothetical protein